MQNSVEENMGLAGINPVVGAGHSSVYITQYTIPNTFTDDSEDRFKYFLSRDVLPKSISRSIIFRDSDGILKSKVSTLEDCDIVSIYRCPVSIESLMNIKESIGHKVSNGFLYEALTGKRLLCSDQLQIDPVLEAIDIDKEDAITESLVQSLYSEFMDLEYPRTRIPLMNYYDELAAEELIGDRQNISIYESVDGYYAEDDITRMRTKCYDKIEDIDLEVLQ